MKYNAVLTGDISNFTKLNDKQREQLIKDTEKLFNGMVVEQQDAKIFRGDSYQILLNHPGQAIYQCLVLFCWFRSHSLTTAELSTRISIGIGKIAYRGKSVLDSDGEAFHISGRAFDHLEKNNYLKLTTPDPEETENFRIILLFINQIIGQWSMAQIRIIYLQLRFPGNTQEQIAGTLNISQPAVAKSLTTARWREVLEGINYISNQLRKKYE